MHTTNLALGQLREQQMKRSHPANLHFPKFSSMETIY
jgi:hypothetical protein